MNLAVFTSDQLEIISKSTLMAEDLVSNSYKLSSGRWLKKKYDIKTMADLCPDEIVHGPFAQILHYKGQPMGSSLESNSYDFYKICLQDHSILTITDKFSNIRLFPFSLYIIIHELIHVVRFISFAQNFYASHDEKMTEEQRVHEKTHQVLQEIKVPGLEEVFDFYRQWLLPIDHIKVN